MGEREMELKYLEKQPTEADSVAANGGRENAAPSPEELLAEAIQRRDYEQVKQLHEVLKKDRAWICDGEVMRHAVKDGEEMFVLWHLISCHSPLPGWLLPLVVSSDAMKRVLSHLTKSGYGILRATTAAASNGSLDDLRRLNQHVKGGWTTMVMDEAAKHGRLDVVQWLHFNRTEGYYLADGVLRQFIKHLCDRSFYPRPSHTSDLLRLLERGNPIDWTMLQYIVRHRRDHYIPDSFENPLEYTEATPSNTSVVPQCKLFVLAAVTKVIEVWQMPLETGERISEFITDHPGDRFTSDTAIRLQWVRWIVRFSTHPAEDMTALADQNKLDDARLIHTLLKRDNKPRCTKRFLYLSMEKGSLEFIKWHVLNCRLHSVKDYLYVAIWIGRVDVVEWMWDNWTDVADLDHDHCNRIPKKRRLFHVLDAPFAEVQKRFEIDFKDVVSFTSDLEQLALHDKWPENMCDTSNEPNWVDIAAINGRTDIIKRLMQYPSAHCTVSGVFGAISRGHISVLKLIYERWPELAQWPKEEDAPEILRYILTQMAVMASSRDTEMGLEQGFLSMLRFFRRTRNMRLDNRTLAETVIRRDFLAVQVICDLDLVESKSNAADIAAIRGDMEILEFLYSFGALCSTRGMDGAAEEGHFGIVQFLHEQNAPYWVYAATWVGRVDVIDWMCTNYSQFGSIGLDDDTGRYSAVQKTMLHSLDASFAQVEERFIVDLEYIEAGLSQEEEAARDGDLQRIMLYCESARSNNRSPNLSNAADLAAIYGHLRVVEYLLQNELASCTVGGLYGAMVGGHVNVVASIYRLQPQLNEWPKREDHSSVLERFLSRDKGKMFQFLRQERNMALDARVLDEAAYRGDLERVRLICIFGLVESTASAADIAAVRGDLVMLETLFALGSPTSKCTTRAMDGAAEEGHMQVVRYLHQRDAPCTRRAIDLSARNGHFEIVQYLLLNRQEGCSPFALFWACARGHVEVVRVLTSLVMLTDLERCFEVVAQEDYYHIAETLEKYYEDSNLDPATNRQSTRSLARWRRQQEDSVYVIPSHGRVVLNEIRQQLGLPALPS
ncbi:hypothetical protein Poli38472_013429 [Pythium oligandrum]|uniref:Ankyrin repeat protein n=1 Tax=Pythium oligandrum TaxID=41045 RepID=A0A8K1C7N5_PYTOL|nr:hypothetical protein Poli38472_013429 [Pythium oligandrum]|eukprot:TMW57955.1 hypothetical protein Poli38472_013429 [Pythium oligandrum]